MRWSLISMKIGRVEAIILLASVFLTSHASLAEEKRQPSSHAAVAAPATKPMLSPDEFRRQEEWRNSIGLAPKPKKGCFTAKFPSKEWQEVPCVPTPDYPMPPRMGIVPDVVGNSNDIAAKAPSGFISSATGSFDNLSGVTSESGQIAASGPAVANAYTLQINTEFFKSTACTGSPNTDPVTGCRGWEQFVFENNNVSHRAYIQYWLIRYNTTCPSGWTQEPSGTDIYCVILNNSSGAVGTSAVPVTNLSQVTLTGTADAGGDSITMTVGGMAYTRAGDNSVNAAAGWTIAEFNVLGDGGNAVGVGSQAGFNAGASIVTRTRIIYGGTVPPDCVATGFTAETNNLSFGATAPASSAPGPALIFAESIAGGALSNCAASTAVGDTHLTTLSGLLYDFQASGDFELLKTKSGFKVQNRQVSGAPTWPNAAVNSAVATLLGRTRVAVCTKPQAIFVDGKSVWLREGRAVLLADGAQIVRHGNTYLIRSAKGDWVQASVNPGAPAYINVNVGLGQWPVEAEGLLVNVKGDPSLIATREGKILKTPFSFEELYHSYADSWRVDPKESMLNLCGEEVKRGTPNKPFSAKDLAPDVAKRVRAICGRAGVKEGAHLDACMIDVAVIGRATAARVHAKTPAPAVVGEIR
jgi:hypothetical protein